MTTLKREEVTGRFHQIITDNFTESELALLISCNEREMYDLVYRVYTASWPPEHRKWYFLQFCFRLFFMRLAANGGMLNLQMVNFIINLSNLSLAKEGKSHV